MTKLLKIMITLTAVVYVLSPDLAAGPLDDIIVMVIGYVVNNRLADRQRAAL